jgi:hypothetical protein
MSPAWLANGISATNPISIPSNAVLMNFGDTLVVATIILRLNRMGKVI